MPNKCWAVYVSLPHWCLQRTRVEEKRCCTKASGCSLGKYQPLVFLKGELGKDGGGSVCTFVPAYCWHTKLCNILLCTSLSSTQNMMLLLATEVQVLSRRSLWSRCANSGSPTLKDWTSCAWWQFYVYSISSVQTKWFCSPLSKIQLRLLDRYEVMICILDKGNVTVCLEKMAVVLSFTPVLVMHALLIAICHKDNQSSWPVNS